MGFNVTTFFFELVNFVVLVWVLERLVFRPLRRGIEQRRAAAAELTARAESREAEAERVRRDYESRTEELGTLRERIVREGTEQAAKERARMLQQAHEDAVAERARVQRLVETEREAALGWARETIVERGTELAGRLLLELAPQSVDRALLDELGGECARLGPELRSDLGLEPASERPEVEVTSARPLPEEAVERLRGTLTDALGVSPRLTLREDERLIAGAVVRTGHRVLDASVDGQLSLLRARARELLESEAKLA